MDFPTPSASHSAQSLGRMTPSSARPCPRLQLIGRRALHSIKNSSIRIDSTRRSSTFRMRLWPLTGWERLVQDCVWPSESEATARRALGPMLLHCRSDRPRTRSLCRPLVGDHLRLPASRPPRPPRHDNIWQKCPSSTRSRQCRRPGRQTRAFFPHLARPPLPHLPPCRHLWFPRPERCASVRS